MNDFQDRKSALYFHTSERVTTITFNRPEILNAFDVPLAERFAKIVKVVAKEPSDTVIVTGEGRAFSAGADLAFLEACTRDPEAKVRQRLKRLYSCFLSVRDLPQVSIAKVNGAVAGGGLGIVWACDLRVVLADAKFAFNFVKIGLSPGMGILYLTTRILGEARARELWLRGCTVRGEDVARWGGATELARTPQELDKFTTDLVEELRLGARLGKEFIKKELLWKDAVGAYVEFNCKHQAKSLKSPEAREGLAAARAKRPADFVGARERG